MSPATNINSFDKIKGLIPFLCHKQCIDYKCISGPLSADIETSVINDHPHSKIKHIINSSLQSPLRLYILPVILQGYGFVEMHMILQGGVSPHSIAHWQIAFFMKNFPSHPKANETLDCHYVKPVADTLLNIFFFFFFFTIKWSRKLLTKILPLNLLYIRSYSHI